MSLTNVTAAYQNKALSEEKLIKQLVDETNNHESLTPLNSMGANIDTLMSMTKHKEDESTFGILKLLMAAVCMLKFHCFNMQDL